MRILFVLDPLVALNAYKDSSVAMMQSLVARGHTLCVAMQGDLFIQNGEVRASAATIELVSGADLHSRAWWVETIAPVDTPLQAFGAVLMPAASIITPIMLLAFTRCPALMINTSQAN